MINSVAYYPNGTEFIIDYFCGIGADRWGTIRAVRLPGETVFREDNTGTSGYIAQNDLVYAFDSDAFVDLNFNSIYGFVDDLNVCEPRFPFVIWTYPNSGVQLEVVTEETLDWFCNQYDPDSQYFPIRMDRIYHAPDGSRWISVLLTRPYTYGWLDPDHPMEGAVIQSFE